MRRGCESAALVWRRARVHARGSAGRVPAALHVFCLLDGAPQVLCCLVCVHVHPCGRSCIHERERERGGERDRQREKARASERASERERLCVCVG